MSFFGVHVTLTLGDVFFLGLCGLLVVGAVVLWTVGGVLALWDAIKRKVRP